jgi:hypothetical protein
MLISGGAASVAPPILEQKNLTPAAFPQQPFQPLQTGKTSLQADCMFRSPPDILCFHGANAN